MKWFREKQKILLKNIFNSFEKRRPSGLNPGALFKTPNKRCVFTNVSFSFGLNQALKWIYSKMFQRTKSAEVTFSLFIHIHRSSSSLEKDEILNWNLNNKHHFFSLVKKKSNFGAYIKFVKFSLSSSLKDCFNCYNYNWITFLFFYLCRLQYICMMLHCGVLTPRKYNWTCFVIW